MDCVPTNIIETNRLDKTGPKAHSFLPERKEVIGKKNIFLSDNKRPTLMGTKNFYENGPNPFFFSRSYGNENGLDSYSRIHLSVS